jgi:hypothetical protein
MAVTTNWYRSVDKALFNKEIDYLDDTIKVALLTSSYTPNLDTHDYHNDLTNEVTGTGYTSGGATLASKTLTVTAANSWATTWATATAFGAEAIVRPTTGNGYLYRAQGTGGTSHAATEPTWPTTIGDEVTDNGVTWTCMGKGIMTIDAADPSWASSTITARYAAIYDDTPGTSATKPLIALIDFGADVSSTAAAFTITFAAVGILYRFYH